MMKKNQLNSLIYIVDDEFAVRESISLFLQSAGLVSRGFESAEEFLMNYNADYPGCLILDVRMPGMNGLDLQHELITRHIVLPIIFISGNAEIPDSAKAFRAGAVDFLQKPFDNSLLLARINEAIDKDISERQKRQEKREIMNRLDRLTKREKEVLGLIIGNHSNKEDAKMLEISHRTIDVHRARIMEKMEAESLSDLMSMVIQNDLLN